MCHRAKLKPSDYFSSLYTKQCCPGLIKQAKAQLNSNEQESYQCPKCDQTAYSQCCWIRHQKLCNGSTVCSTCQATIKANRARGETLETKLAAHKCWASRCKNCFSTSDDANPKSHQCPMQPVSFPKEYCKLAVWDAETHEVLNGREKQPVLHDMFLSLYYETFCHGYFYRVNFADSRFRHRENLKITPSALIHDYLPSSEKNLLIRKGQKNNLKADLHHYDISTLDASVDHISEIKADYEAYLFNLQRFKPLVPLSFRRRPIFFFFCFIFHERRRGTIFLAHNASAFDNVLFHELLVHLDIKFDVITKGNKVLQIHIPAYNLTFIDSIQYLSGSLASLTSRFDLPFEKLQYPHTFNQLKNWNQPWGAWPDLAHFISDRDNLKQRREKEKLWIEWKDRETWFDHNKILAKYGAMDSKILASACCHFLQQAFAFQILLLNRFGQSPAWKKSKKKFIHPFSPTSFTLSTYRYKDFSK